MRRREGKSKKLNISPLSLHFISFYSFSKWVKRKRSENFNSSPPISLISFQLPSPLFMSLPALLCQSKQHIRDTPFNSQILTESSLRVVHDYQIQPSFVGNECVNMLVGLVDCSLVLIELDPVSIGLWESCFLLLYLEPFCYLWRTQIDGP